MNNALGFPFGFFTNDNTPADAKYYRNFNTTGAKTPYFTITDATNLLVAGIRYQGLTINIAGIEYWFKNGIANSDLIAKTPDLSSYATTSYVTNALTDYIPLSGSTNISGNYLLSNQTYFTVGLIDNSSYTFFTKPNDNISVAGVIVSLAGYTSQISVSNNNLFGGYQSAVGVEVGGPDLLKCRSLTVTYDSPYRFDGDVLILDNENRNAAISAEPKALVTNEWVTANFTGTGGGTTTFTGLTDVPNSYISQKFKTPRVKENETGLEYVNVPVTKEILLTSTGSITFTATHSLNNLYHNITVLDAQTNKIIYPEIIPGLVFDTLIWSIAPTSGFTFSVTITGLQKSIIISSGGIGSMAVGSTFVVGGSSTTSTAPSVTSSSYFSNDYSTSDYTA